VGTSPSKGNVIEMKVTGEAGAQASAETEKQKAEGGKQKAVKTR
jgi:hypothetical protein